MARRPLLAVCGSGDALSPALEARVRELGRLAVEAGLRVATGGLGGVMTAVSEGARAASRYREGDVIGIIPGLDKATANPAVDVVIATGMGIARNLVLVASADVVVAVDGGAGTLVEIAAAWQLGRPVVALRGEGWSGRLAGDRIDDRRPDRIEPADDPAHAIALAVHMVASILPRP